MAPPNFSKLKNQAQKINRAPKKNSIFWPAILFSIAFLGLIYLFFRDSLISPLVTVTEATVMYPSQNYTLLYSSGYVVPQRKAALSSKAQGRLEWLGVLEGTKVKKGQVIARLEKDDVEATLRQAIAQEKIAQANLAESIASLTEAESNFKRSQELLKKKFIARATHDSNNNQLEMSKAKIKAMEAHLASSRANVSVAKIAVAQTIITAPFDGVILTISANVGDNITPFSSAADSKGAVVTIADMDTLEVEADVSESRISQIKVNQPCEITLDAIPNKRFEGFVSRMVPTVDRSKATILVKVQFLEYDDRVLPDMSAKVAFLTKKLKVDEKDPMLTLPRSAISKSGTQDSVFVYRDGAITKTLIQIGYEFSERVQIFGINAGDKVVNPMNIKMRDGMRVKLGP